MGKLCRTCLKIIPQDPIYLNTFLNFKESKTVLLSDVLRQCASIQILELDGFPQVICEECLEQAKNYFNFKTTCEESDKFLHSKFFKAEEIEADLKLTSFKEEAKDIPDIYHEKLTDFGDNDNNGYSSDSRSSETSNNKLVDKKENSFSCNLCNNVFFEEEKYNDHLKIHSELKCTECDLSFKWLSELTQHTKTHGTVSKKHPRTCQVCGKVFQRRESLSKHKKIHEGTISCKHCDFIPSTFKQLSQHMEDLHAHLKSWACTYCEKKFFKQRNLQIHLVIHTGVKSHTCEFCGMSFAHPSNLTTHRRKHTGNRPYSCATCGKSFAQWSTLKQHETLHIDQKDHICAQCGAAFRRKRQLLNHLRRHSADKPFSCTICDAAFKSNAEKKRHMDIHTGVKNHICDFCGKAFNRKENLSVHRKIHTGETPHICNVCGKGFIQAHCLRTHMNTHGASKNKNSTMIPNEMPPVYQ